MAARDNAKHALPTSHFFVTIARGHSARTFVTRSSVAFAVLLLTPLLGLWLCGSTLYLAFHDDLVASLMLHQRDMQYDYEDRIATLRSQVDREVTNRLTSQRSVVAKLDELTAREAELANRSGIVFRLQDQAAHVTKGQVGARTLAGRAAGRADQALLSFAPHDEAMPALAFAPDPHDRRVVPKPRPEAALPTMPFGPAGGTTATSAATVAERVSELSTGLDRISTGQESQLAAIEAGVRKTMGRYHEALDAAGITEQRLAAHDEPASGGPFVPLAGNDDASPFARATVGLQLSLSQVERLEASIARVPFSKPLRGDPDVTSPFGARLDPFLGRPAMHTGIDLADDNGTEVRATAPGRVTVAGQSSGYGTMVEIDHGAGLVTRYAHLSEAAVAIGQAVRLGEVIGRVGATGRATGPHLHYETRIDGEAVDPLRFLAAGRRLGTEDKAL